MNGEWPRHYILVGRTPMAVDLMTWARMFEKNDRHVGIDHVTDACRVSTVFLGLDHGFGRGDPVLFETMIFGGPLDGEMERYSTYDQAERGHAEAVTKAKIACAKVKALADAAGATTEK